MVNYRDALKLFPALNQPLAADISDTAYSFYTWCNENLWDELLTTPAVTQLDGSNWHDSVGFF